MTSTDYPYLEQALPGFHQARQIIKEHQDGMLRLGFVGDKFDFYRFVNRFRLAISLTALQLQDFGEETQEGYTALTRTFLIWSAFECYAQLANDRPPFRQLLAYHSKKHLAALAHHCRQQDPDHRLTNFLIAQSPHPKYETHLKRYLDGHDLSVLTLAACIRHIFAHGNLTAHPNQLPAQNLINITTAIHNFLVHFLHTDFTRRLTIAENHTP